MERIPFDIKRRPEIEAGKYLVETRDGCPVRIVCWDRKGVEPIVALLGDGRDEEVGTFHTNGVYIRGQQSARDLFLVPNPDYKEPTTTCSTSVDWDAFRRKAVDCQVVGKEKDLRLIDSTQRCLFTAKRGDWLKIIIVKED
jgi:hypothetical protein